VDPLTLSAVGAVALTEGVKFLYAQAGELLSAWRQRRRDASAPPPNVLETPETVTLQGARPPHEPPSRELEDTLQDLYELVQPIARGDLDPTAPDSRRVIANLRDLLEVALHAPITFAGEAQRTLDVSDVEVTVKRVAGSVTGLRAKLNDLTAASIHGVNVRAEDVEEGGTVTGVELS
jgi:hypothetical protein